MESYPGRAGGAWLAACSYLGSTEAASCRQRSQQEVSGGGFGLWLHGLWVVISKCGHETELGVEPQCWGLEVLPPCSWEHSCPYHSREKGLPDAPARQGKGCGDAEIPAQTAGSPPSVGRAGHWARSSAPRALRVPCHLRGGVSSVLVPTWHLAVPGHSAASPSGNNSSVLTPDP